MTVRALDHYNIRTPDVLGTARFYERALGMTIVDGAPGADPSLSSWIADQDGGVVIHIGSTSIPYPGEAHAPAGHGEHGSAAIHHVAFRCDGFDETLAHLESERIPAETYEYPTMNLKQIFVRDPNGIRLELNFFGQ